MLFKTRGVVFRFTKYGETSIIVNIFTELFGLQSYIVNGARSKSSKNKIALYQPLTLVDLVVYHRENANILRIKEIKCLHPYLTIYQDVRKSSIAMFLSEIVNKAVKEQSHAEEICEFLIHAFMTLDQLPSVDNFHLIFLLKLSRHLGFGPQAIHDVLGSYRVDPGEEKILHHLLTSEYDQHVAMPRDTRRNLLDCLLRFYASHIENLGEIRSVGVLKEVLT